MPLYDCICSQCGKTLEVIRPIGGELPRCCGEVMTRLYSIEAIKIKMKYPMWVDRMDDIHKRQSDKGERLRYIHPKEVGAT
jgi:hypothetical protein